MMYASCASVELLEASRNVRLGFVEGFGSPGSLRPVSSGNLAVGMHCTTDTTQRQGACFFGFGVASSLLQQVVSESCWV